MLVAGRVVAVGAPKRLDPVDAAGVEPNPWNRDAIVRCC